MFPQQDSLSARAARLALWACALYTAPSIAQAAAAARTSGHTAPPVAAAPAGTHGIHADTPGASRGAGRSVTLATVTVTASLNRTSIQDMPLHTTVIDAAAIANSPARTLDQLLRAIPGFDFTGVPAAISDPTGQQTRMRGLGNAKVLVLLDGVPLIDPFYLTTQFYKVPLSSIDHIEVIRGGTSSLWGSMAVAGLVNIVTRRPHDDSGVITLGAGSEGAANVDWSQDYQVSDAVSVNLSANQYRTDGYLTTPARYRWKFPEQRATSARDTNVELSTYLRFSDRLNGFIRAGWHRQDQQIGYLHGRNLQNNPDLALGLDQRFGAYDTLAWRAWAQWVHFTKFNGATCYYQPVGGCLSSNSPNQRPSDDVVQYYTQFGDQRYREQGTSLTYSTFFRGFFDSIQVGAEARRLWAEDAEQFFATPSTPLQPQVLNAVGFGQGHQTFGGAFVQAKFSPVGPLQVTVSGRYDAWRSSDQVNTLTQAATGIVTGGVHAPTRKTAFDPGLGLHYDLSDRWSLRGAAYRAFRAPGFNNITRSYGVGPTTVANPELGPETMAGWEVGSDYRGQALTLSATWFTYNLRDMIATYRINSATGAPAPVLALCSTSAETPNLDNCGGTANYYTNDQNGRSRGVELEGGWQVAPTLKLGAWFTYTRTFLTSKLPAITTPLHAQLVGVPERSAALDATWQPNARLTAYVQALYTGPLYLDETTTPGVNYGQGGSVIYNGSLRYHVTPAVDVALDVVNALDRPYSENAYPITRPWLRTLSSPRTFFVSTRIRY